ncbi:hypothetical protein PQR39_35165 [Paraburkholderia sediminicola]|uniref:hypothetical protein n=1 Tax=Paraburkholderia sediminicola TaxID=458836 RepID=UPI0038BDB508
MSSIPQPAQPLLSDSDLLSGSGSQVADKLWVDHTVSKDYIGDLLAAVTACSKLPAQLPALK